MKDLNKVKENKEKHRIALIGHMGSGKTTFGKLISRGLLFVVVGMVFFGCQKLHFFVYII